MESQPLEPDAPWDLQQFVLAQEPVIAEVMEELRAGRKQSHWMWFVFPQRVELGRSAMARRYGIVSREEARAYLDHPILGPRLETCFQLVLRHPEFTANEIFGAIDALKLCSSATLFEQDTGPESVYAQVLRVFFGGVRDALTLKLP